MISINKTCDLILWYKCLITVSDTVLKEILQIFCSYFKLNECPYQCLSILDTCMQPFFIPGICHDYVSTWMNMLSGSKLCILVLFFWTEMSSFIRALQWREKGFYCQFSTLAALVTIQFIFIDVQIELVELH